MPLHRDIHWIGRQWAVTGHGMQLIDQKLQGFFDIETVRLWDDILIESLYAKEWLNRADFDKGLALARARYPQPSGAETSAQSVAPLPAIEPVAPLPPAVKPVEPKPETPKLEIAKPVEPTLAKTAAVEPPRVELKAPAIAARTSVDPPKVMPPQQAASPSAAEPVASLPPVVKAGEAKRGSLTLGAPETLVKRRPVETQAAAVPPTPAASPPAAAPAAPAAPLPPFIAGDASERVVFVKPGVIEPLRAVAEPAAAAISTNASSVEPSPPPTLFQMRYEGRARFVRPWRVVARKI
jgi:hypothetical protein